MEQDATRSAVEKSQKDAITRYAALAGALLLGGLSAFLPGEELAARVWAIILYFRLNNLLTSVFGEPQARAFVSDYFYLFFGLLGAVLGAAACRRGFRLIAALGEPRPAEILRPVCQVGSYDPLWAPATERDLPVLPIDWVPPSPGGSAARYRLWTELVRFLNTDVGDGRLDWLMRPRRKVVRFRVALLTGPSGAGKTRMATELARARARREVLGADPAEADPDLLKARFRARARLILGEFLRRRIFLLARREPSYSLGGADPEAGWKAAAPATVQFPWTGCDPWDAWWLVSPPGEDPVSHDGRQAFDGGLIAQLSCWRPRRPTLLLLDDPRDGDAAQIVAALQKSETQFRHPVRLIVMQQTPPIALDLINAEGKFESKIRGVDQYFVLDEGMGPAEVRGLAGTLYAALEAMRRQDPTRPRPVVHWQADDRSVDEVIRRTAGNPLLIVLDLHRRFLNPADGDQSLRHVLARRAKRIHEALRDEQIGDDRIRAVALATLVGDVSIPPAVRAGIPLLQGGFPPKLLGAVPNLRRGEGGPPRVHPERIGDAFVAYLLDAVWAETERDEVIRLAWQIAPEAMPHASWRLSLASEAVAANLWREMGAASERDPLGTTLAFLRWACLIPRLEWDLGDVPGPAPFPRLEPNGLEGLPDPETAARHRALNQRADHARREVLARIGALPPALAAQAWEQMATLLTIDRTIAVVHGRTAWRCLMVLTKRVLGDSSVWSTAEDAARATEILSSLLLAFGTWGGMPGPAGSGDDIEILRSLLRRLTSYPQAVAVLERDFDQLTDIFSNNPIRPYIETVFQVVAAAVLDDLGENFTGEGDDGDGARARAWRIRGWALRADRPACEAVARRIEQWAAAFPSEASIQRERAEAWLYASQACGGSEEIARRIDQIAAPFAGDDRIAWVRARAWRAVGEVSADEPRACEVAARRVDEICAPFAGEARFEVERAQAWRHVCCAFRDDRGACEEAARRVDEICAPFAGEARFEEERAQAWRTVCYAFCDDRGACEALARRVDEICAPFAGESSFEEERAQAWRTVCYAFCDDLGACEALARRVDGICAPFAGESSFEEERALAWRTVCHAFRDDRGACEAMARRVEEICAPFAGAARFEVERAQAWRTVCHAFRDDRGACEALARRVDEICAPFAGESSFEEERAQAWRTVCHAFRDDRGACEALARRVDEICAPFAGEARFEVERAQAWRNVCYAFRDDRGACEAMARRVEEICAPFAGEASFEVERAQAWRNACYACREDREAYEAMVRQVDEICVPFAGDPKFERERAEVRRYASWR
ncbi:hypothetical protein [Phaeospirillum tilakii]|uniref:AAA+ ATPase domain-containing protein n=1 Tax=Phaeospirillum tilakii TaxID=741673 RepID=A0ABW5C8A9_9PROT